MSHSSTALTTQQMPSSERKRVKRYPISESLSEVWLSSQVSDDANCAYNECLSLELKGNLSADALERALQRVVERNEMLRSTFANDGQHVCVHEQLPCECRYIDWSSLSDIDLAKARRRVCEEEGSTAFDLARGPLLRARLQKLGEQHHLLTVTAHHLIMDGWSWWLFCRDLGHVYSAEFAGEEPNVPKLQSHEEFAAAMRAYEASDEAIRDEDFWLTQFERTLPVFDLPTDRPRPALKTFEADRCDYVLDAKLIAELRKLGARSGCSLFHTMLAAFDAFLSRITGQQDVCVGIPAAGQAAMEMPEVLGHCVNSLALRTQVDLTLPFVQFAKQVKAQVLDAMDHQKYTFGALLRKLAPPRDPSRPPIFPLMFNVDPQINIEELGFEDLDVEILVEPRSRENFEWFINGVINHDGTAELQCQYNTNLFDRETITEYLAGYEALLRHAVCEPQTALRDLKILNRKQAQRMLVDWNATNLDYPAESTLHAEFVQRAHANPDQIAIEFGERRMTFGQLDLRSNQLARLLQSMSVTPSDLVGVSLHRSDQLLVTLLAVLKCGAGYVPLDPAYPDERLRYMCQDSDLRLIVTQVSLTERVTSFGPPTLVIENQEEALAEQDSRPLAVEVTAADIAYVIYTSGSTGKPKGVKVPHGAVINFLYGMQRHPGFTSHDRLLAVTTPSFDISVLEFFLPLVVGGQLVIADQETVADGALLAEKLDDANISVFQATPATWRMMIEAGWEGRSALKALCGGEPLSVDLVEPLLDRCDQLWNMYGPTETTVWSTVFRVTDPNEILVGRPIANTQVYILDAHLQPVPVGVTGEVYLGGSGVTLGYLNRPELTAERFVENPFYNPFKEHVNHRLYRTGDLARFRRDGNIEFLRRNDKQVKVRGFRIELGEIEHHLRTHDSVQQAIVTIRGGGSSDAGDTRLLAYLICDKQGVTASDLRTHLRTSLPHYMIPQHFVELEEFPQTSNGKIDYQALPQPDGAFSSDVEFVAPVSPQELMLAEIWREVLEVDAVGVNDNFFSLGGHSLLVMKVIAQVEDQTGLRLNPQEFLMGTLEQLAMKLPAIREETEPMLADPQPVDLDEVSQGIFATLKSLWT